MNDNLEQRLAVPDRTPSKDDDFILDSFYYHLDTKGLVLPVEIVGNMVVVTYKNTLIRIPKKIIKLKDDSNNIWVHRYIFSQILEKNGFDSEFEVDEIEGFDDE